MVDVVLHLRLRQPEHYGDYNKTTFSSSGVDFHPLNAVIGKNGKPVALFHAHVGESVREPARTLIPLFEGKFPVKVFGPYLVWLLGGIYLENFFSC
jgi:hypothetical protein